MLGEILAPTLVIVGDQDNYASPGHVDTSKYLAKALPNAEYVCVSDVAHALHVETAAIFNEAVATFLSNH